jgi:putative membrane protein
MSTPGGSCAGRPEVPDLKIAAYIGGVIGLTVLIALLVRSDYVAMLHTLGAAGWSLLWLTPYRIVFFLLYALGWLALLRPYDPNHRAGLGFLLWVTSVREAIDRLLPVASVGGGVVGIRLLRWRGIPTSGATASVVVEVVLTLAVSYIFTGLGLLLLTQLGTPGQSYRTLLVALLFALPVPVVTTILLRYGSVFGRLEKFIRPLIGADAFSNGAASLDHELQMSLSRGRTVVVAGMLQLAALASASFEVWFVLRLFGRPVDARSAIVLESLTQAMRHLAFFVPGGWGVQEAAFVIFGQTLGIGSETALALSMAKRLREVLCGLPCLLSWQLLEGWRLRWPKSV